MRHNNEFVKKIFPDYKRKSTYRTINEESTERNDTK